MRVRKKGCCVWFRMRVRSAVECIERILFTEVDNVCVGRRRATWICIAVGHLAEVWFHVQHQSKEKSVISLFKEQNLLFCWFHYMWSTQTHTYEPSRMWTEVVSFVHSTSSSDIRVCVLVCVCVRNDFESSIDGVAVNIPRIFGHFFEWIQLPNFLIEIKAGPTRITTSCEMMDSDEKNEKKSFIQFYSRSLAAQNCHCSVSFFVFFFIYVQRVQTEYIWRMIIESCNLNETAMIFVCEKMNEEFGPHNTHIEARHNLR